MAETRDIPRYNVVLDRHNITRETVAEALAAAGAPVTDDYCVFVLARAKSMAQDFVWPYNSRAQGDADEFKWALAYPSAAPCYSVVTILLHNR